MPGKADWPTHRCPGPECTEQVGHDRLACLGHWRQVPWGLQKAVYRAWANGHGQGTEEHMRACDAAVATMRELGSRR